MLRAEDALVTEVFINLNDFEVRRSNHSGGTQKGHSRGRGCPQGFSVRKTGRTCGRARTRLLCRAARDREDEEKHPKNLYLAFRVFFNLSDEAKPLISYLRFTPCIDSAARREGEHAGPKCRRTCSDAVACPVLGDSSFSVISAANCRVRSCNFRCAAELSDDVSYSRASVSDALALGKKPFIIPYTIPPPIPFCCIVCKTTMSKL